MSEAEAERKVVSQSEYEDQVHETRWVDLEDGEGSMQVQEVPPLRLIREMQEYNVSELLGAEGDEVDVQEAIGEGDFNGFLNDVVIPNIQKPDAYWSDGEGDFDLATLTPQDLMRVITGLTGRDADELEEDLDDEFQG